MAEDFKVGDKVLVGKNRRYTVGGVIEDVKGNKFGVRYENGNFAWVKADQMKKMGEYQAKRLRIVGESTSALLERLEKIRSGEETMGRDFQTVGKELRRVLVGKAFGADYVRSVQTNMTMSHDAAPLGAVYTMTIDTPADPAEYRPGFAQSLHLVIKRTQTKGPFEIYFMYGGGARPEKVFKGSAGKPGKVRPERFEQDVMEYVKMVRKRLGKLTGP